MTETKCPTIISLLGSARAMNAATDIYKDEEAIEKYALAILYNEYAEFKKDEIDLVKFNKKRTKLTESQMKLAENNVIEMKKALSKNQKEYQAKLDAQKEQERLVKFSEAEKITFIIDGKEFKESEIMDSNGDITNSTIADFIIKYYSPFTFEGNLYFYLDGIYILDDNRKIGVSKVNQIIENIVTHVYDTKRLEDRRNKIIGEIQTLVMLRNRFEEDPFDKYDDMICVNNGIVKFDWKNKTYELLPHSPKFTFRTKYAFNVDPKVDTTNVKQWLGTLSIDKSKNCCNLLTYRKMTEMAAAPIVMQLTRGTFKSSYLFIGKKHSGKTTFTEDFLKIRFYGENACSGTSLKDLCEERFGKDSIIGKTVNICDDLSDPTIKNAGKWKQLTGGGRVEVESKFQRKVSVFFPLAIFTANDFPKVSNVDEDTAFWDRWQLIQLTNVFEKDINYAKNLDEYISPFALLVIDEIFKLKEKGSVSNTDVRQILIQNWKRDNDSVQSFTYKTLEYDPNGCVPISKMYDIYSEHCEDNGFYSKNRPDRSIRQFKTDIEELIRSNCNYELKEDRIEWNQSRPTIYKGIRFKTSPLGNFDLIKKYKTENSTEIQKIEDQKLKNIESEQKLI